MSYQKSVFSSQVEEITILREEVQRLCNENHLLKKEKEELLDHTICLKKGDGRQLPKDLSLQTIQKNRKQYMENIKLYTKLRKENPDTDEKEIEKEIETLQTEINSLEEDAPTRKKQTDAIETLKSITKISNIGT